MAPTKKASMEPTRRSERVQVAKAIEKSNEETNAKITKLKRFRRPQQRKSCRFLALPGELRNAIYRHALLENFEIRVTSTGPGQPALLKTCRAIRAEATGIYYGENDFTLCVVDYKGADILPFRRQYRWTPGSEGDIFFEYLGKPNWDNLMEWMRVYDTSNAFLPEISDEKDFSSEHLVLEAAIKIVQAMVWLPWFRKEEALQGLYEGLRAKGYRWVKTEDRHW